ncbi:hypothetical protein [Sphingomonas sp.]|uniref:hypothetical protein n=1 Tax=Sphingomonas sp. TaxID=28214 RepID=UPI003BACF775
MSALPEGDYAIVEILGHRTIIGRVEEVERFGTKLMSIEPLFNGGLLQAVLIGGSSIYQFTPCSADVAAERSPKEEWQLPASVRAVLPPIALAGPETPLPDFVHSSAAAVNPCPHRHDPAHDIWECVECRPF